MSDVKTTTATKTTKKAKLTLQNVIKIYHSKSVDVSALRGITCEFYKGEISVIMGPSGCGKTTLLNQLGGIDIPTSGSIFLETNEDITRFTEKEFDEYRKFQVGYLFQTLNLIPHLSAFDNVLLPLKIQKRYSDEKKEEILQQFDRLNLSNRLKHYPDQLSGGKQQRVALIRVAVKDPEVLLCDEPTGELDSEHKEKIMKLITDIHKDHPSMTIIIVTHDPDFKIIADRVFFLRDGKISYILADEKLEEYKTEQSNQISSIRVKDSKNSIAQKIKSEKIEELEELSYLINTRLKELKGE